MVWKVYGMTVSRRRNVVTVKSRKHTLKIVGHSDGPKVYYDGRFVASRPLSKKTLGKSAPIWRFVKEVESPESRISPLSSWDRGSGCSLIFIYKFKGRIYIVSGCYDSYTIFEVKKGKVVEYYRFYYSGWSNKEYDELYRVKEYRM